MKLHQLKKTTTSKKKRVGRGYGSGVGGHTATRGTKGQKSRSSIPIWFEGGQLPFIRRLPFQRGKGRFKSLKPETLGINISNLDKLKAKTKVTAKTLLEYGIVSASDIKTKRIKILGGGKITKALTITLPTSKNARAKIEKAGGSVES